MVTTSYNVLESLAYAFGRDRWEGIKREVKRFADENRVSKNIEENNTIRLNQPDISEKKAYPELSKMPNCTFCTLIKAYMEAELTAIKFRDKICGFEV